MLKTSDEIKSQITSNYQKLIDDVLAKSDDNCPLYFADEQEHYNLFKTPFPTDINSRFWFDNRKYYIFLKQLEELKIEEELSIAHELGHLWLSLSNFPKEKISSCKNRQYAYDNFFGLLYDIMAHAIFYPYLKNDYKIDLYKIGNNRLIDFLKNQFPGMRNTSQEEKLLLIFNYIKYTVESDDQYGQGIMNKLYSKKAPDSLRIIEDSLLPIIHELVSEPNPENFKGKYRATLEVLEDNFDISREFWPVFIESQIILQFTGKYGNFAY